jgi:hypothetical protein
MAARRTRRVAPRPRPRPSSSPMVPWRAMPLRIARPGSFFGGGRCEPQLLGQAWCALARVEPPPPPQFERRWESDSAPRAADSDAAENHSEADVAWRKRLLSGLLTAGQHPYPREVVPRPCRVLGHMAVLAHKLRGWCMSRTPASAGLSHGALGAWGGRRAFASESWPQPAEHSPRCY